MLKDVKRWFHHVGACIILFYIVFMSKVFWSDKFSLIFFDAIPLHMGSICLMFHVCFKTASSSLMAICAAMTIQLLLVKHLSQGMVKSTQSQDYSLFKQIP